MIRPLLAYTPAEVSILSAYYPSGGPRTCMPLLPGRSHPSIVQAARRRGLHNRPKDWTKEEIESLQHSWHVVNVNELAKRFNRTISGIYHKARQLGLPLGIPVNMESMTASAKRTGFDSPTLRNIMAYSKVVPMVIPTLRDSRAKGKFKHQCVDKFEIDCAVEAWLNTEIVTSAAKARGLTDRILRLRLIWENIPGMPKKRKRYWRVPTEVIDRVVAKYGLKPKEREQAAE